jgi:hypothetical protein
MDLKTHLGFSAVLVESLEQTTGSKITAFWFKLGSIMPDVSLPLRISEHHLIKSHVHIKRYIKRATKASISSTRLSYLLGKTSHYIADTFCLMHNHKRGKNLKAHVAYEKELAKLFIKIKDFVSLETSELHSAFQDATEGSLIDYLFEKNLSYFANHEASETDHHAQLRDIAHVFICNMNVLTAMILKDNLPVYAEDYLQAA